MATSKRKPPVAASAPVGRPSIYSQALADQICEHIVDGMSLRQIAQMPGMPGVTTILNWLCDDKKPEFRVQYARARELQAEAMAFEILEIADNSRVGQRRTTKADGGIEIVEVDMIERARLQVDARKWLMAKLLPKKYGEKKDEDSSENDVNVHGGLPD